MTEPKDNQEDKDEEIKVEPVHDPEGYIQERRLKEIFDARKEVRERRMEAKQYHLENENTPRSLDAVRMYRSAVENYLSELKPLFMEEDKGKEYWYNVNVGVVEMELPVKETLAGRGGKTIYKYNGSKIARKPDSKEIELVGIGCLFTLPEPLTVEFDVTKKFGLDRTKLTSVAHTGAIPFAQLDRIVNLANQYLSDRGMELDPEDDTDPARI